ncbi:MAG: hypothetical protein HKN70_12410 [Gammaproteobacteria bacterium]|nr:hypothetical protein [Gammaproteobacteria bacterium]
MYNVRWLTKVARQGLTDLVPAVRQAFNDDPGDDRLALVYGKRPRAHIIGIAVAGAGGGALFSLFGPGFPFKDEINWSAVLIGAAYAILVRRYLFSGTRAQSGDFPWLAASMVPAVFLLMVISVLAHFVPATSGTSDQTLFSVGNLLVAITDALGVAAAMTIAFAALCYSRNWLHALWDLAVRLVVFKFMVWLTALIVLDIGIIGPLIASLMAGVFGVRIPDWLPELVDQLSYSALLSVAYLAVIGATWTVCRRSISELLATGHVDVLATVAAMAKNPEKTRKRQAK